jgi:calcineurin-like phosphoesterase family protein
MNKWFISDTHFSHTNIIKVGRHQVELIHIPSHQAPSYFQIHGHVREKRPNKLVGRQLNLSVEVWDYKPVPEKTMIALLDRADPILKSDSQIDL